MSGLFTPIESMSKWAPIVTELNPLKYFVEVMRIVMLKKFRIYGYSSSPIKNFTLCYYHEWIGDLEV